jgi:hypothetical protein
MKIHLAGLKLFYVYGQTDGIKELTITIRKFKTEHTLAELLQLSVCTPPRLSGGYHSSLALK